MKIHGVQYSPQAVVRVKTSPEWSVDEPFMYGRIEVIFVYQDNKIFLLKALNVVKFSQHFKSFEVEDSSEIFIVTYHDFYRFGVLHTKTKNSKHYLIEKDNADVSFLT